MHHPWLDIPDQKEQKKVKISKLIFVHVASLEKQICVTLALMTVLTEYEIRFWKKKNRTGD